MQIGNHFRIEFEVDENIGYKVMTLAEYLGKSNNLLESKLKELYDASPLSIEFINWIKIPDTKRKKLMPPI